MANIGWNPKVFMRSLEAPALNPGEQKAVTLNGKRLTESSIASSLPALSMIVNNSSFGEVKIILNGDDGNSFNVPAGALMPFAGYPITEITVRSITPAVSISAGDVSFVLLNDMAETLRFYQCKKLGLVPYV